MAESPVSAMGISELACYAVKRIMEDYSINPVYKEVPEPGYVKPKSQPFYTNSGGKQVIAGYLPEPEAVVPTIRVVDVDKTRALIRSKVRMISVDSASYQAAVSVLRQLWCHKFNYDWWALNLDECTFIACFVLETVGEKADRIALLAIAQVLDKNDDQNGIFNAILNHRAMQSATIAKLLGKKR